MQVIETAEGKMRNYGNVEGKEIFPVHFQEKFSLHALTLILNETYLNLKCRCLL